MSERLFNLLILCGAAVYVFFGWQIHAPFAYDPLGPRALPLIVGTVLFVLCLFKMFASQTTPLRVEKSLGGVTSALLLYVVFFNLLGFMLATTVAAYLIARSVGGSWMEGALTGLIIAIFFYGVFYFLLGVDLPLGIIFRTFS